mmetsp:Transcript_32444/g.89745  ORF Transcript_32444/g.89745 Transcript_32444/m.89745 type:complete len:299 (-) Transcript_32444:2235-3131(-)
MHTNGRRKVTLGSSRSARGRGISTQRRRRWTIIALTGGGVGVRGRRNTVGGGLGLSLDVLGSGEFVGLCYEFFGLLGVLAEVGPEVGAGPHEVLLAAQVAAARHVVTVDVLGAKAEHRVQREEIRRRRLGAVCVRNVAHDVLAFRHGYDDAYDEYLQQSDGHDDGDGNQHQVNHLHTRKVDLEASKDDAAEQDGGGEHHHDPCDAVGVNGRIVELRCVPEDAILVVSEDVAVPSERPKECPVREARRNENHEAAEGSGEHQIPVAAQVHFQEIIHGNFRLSAAHFRTRPDDESRQLAH